MLKLVEEPPKNARVLYVDQSDVGLYPPIGNDWGLRNQQTKVRTQGKNHKVYLFGALDAHDNRLYVDFWDRKDSDAFLEFLKALLRAIPRKRLYLILDNYIVHHSLKTQAFLKTRAARRLHFVFLPTYSPWLNRIEMTWRFVKARAGTNQWRDTLEQTRNDYLDTMIHMGANTLRTAFTSAEGSP